MKFSVGFMGAVLLSTASAGSLAGAQAGASSMLCAVTYTVSCDSLGDCIEGPASAVNLPVFFKFDPETKVVESARQGGERRTSKVDHIAGTDEVIVLLGDEQDTGWSATISKSSGTFTGTVSAQDAGYLIFGSCIPID